MTLLLDHVIDRLRALPAETQDEIAAKILDVMDLALPPEELTAEEEAAVRQGLLDVENGDVVSYEEVKALLARYGG